MKLLNSFQICTSPRQQLNNAIWAGGADGIMATATEPALYLPRSGAADEGAQKCLSPARPLTSTCSSACQTSY